MDSLYRWSDTTKIGVAFTGFGVFFFVLGVVLLLDRALLTMGNLLFVAGIALVMGPARFHGFFRARLRAAVCFFAGMLLVVCGWCLLGLLLQGFGTLNLFGNFFPMIVRVLESAPLIGPLLLTAPAQRALRLLRLGSSHHRNRYV